MTRLRVNTHHAVIGRTVAITGEPNNPTGGSGAKDTTTLAWPETSKTTSVSL